MLNALRVLFHFIGLLIRYFIKGIRVSKLPVEERREQGLKYVQIIGNRTLDSTRARVVYHGLENLPEDRSFYIIANHQSYFDIPTIMRVMDRPTAFIAKNSLSKVPLLHRWLENLGCLYLDRDDARQAVTIMKQAAEQMEQGMNMVIFPEGTRSKGKQTHEFRRGSLKPAFLAKVPIVPVMLDGTANIFEANPGFAVRPAEVHVYVGRPIETAEMSRTEQKELSGVIGEIIFKQKEIIR